MDPLLSCLILITPLLTLPKITFPYLSMSINLSRLIKLLWLGFMVSNHPESPLRRASIFCVWVRNTKKKRYSRSHLHCWIRRLAQKSHVKKISLTLHKRKVQFSMAKDLNYPRYCFGEINPRYMLFKMVEGVDSKTILVN